MNKVRRCGVKGNILSVPWSSLMLWVRGTVEVRGRGDKRNRNESICDEEGLQRV